MGNALGEQTAPISGIVLMNKPEGFTSFDVIGKLRGLLKTKKMGHSGTLDPMATGVLPVFVGKATGVIPYLQDEDKAYKAMFCLGFTTDTYDRTGKVLTESPVAAKFSDVEALLPSFTGEILQVPPLYSAIKIGGQKMVDIARRGGQMDIPPRLVTIHTLALSKEGGKNEYGLFVACSKGTYVRSLVYDIGQKLGCGATLTALSRTAACGYALEDCLTFADVETYVRQGDFSFIRPLDSALLHWPSLFVKKEEEHRFLNGAKLPVDSFEPVLTSPELAPALYRVYDEDKRFLGLVKWAQAEGVFRIERLFGRER